MTLTPEQFNMLVTKDELKDYLRDLREDLRADNERIVNSIDEFAKKVEISDVEKLSNQSAHDRFEKRITKIENHVGLPMTA